jgi:integrase/recombinase XerD
MQYLNKDELRRLFQVAYSHNRRYHLALVTALWHGMRVSELNNLRGSDVTADGNIIVRRLKGSNQSLQPIRRDVDPLFDESPILELARERRSLRLFEVSRQHFDRLIKLYGTEAGIHVDKLHMHALKHSVAMLLWDVTGNLGQLQSYLGHKAASSTLVYLYEADARKAQTALAGITL